MYKPPHIKDMSQKKTTQKKPPSRSKKKQGPENTDKSGQRENPSDSKRAVPTVALPTPAPLLVGETEKSKQNDLILSDQALPLNLFILPSNGPLVFPTLLAPILVTHPRFVSMIEEAINRERVIGLILTRSGNVREDIKPEDLYQVGVAVKIIKRLKMPDGSINLLIHSMKRFRIRKVLSELPNIVVEADYLQDVVEKSTETDALTRSVISHVKKLAEVNPFFTEEMRLAMINAPGPGTVADLVAFALTLPKADAQDYLETLPVKSRFEKLLISLRREQDVADLQRKINEDVNSKLGKLQREFFLKEQLKSIKKELGMEVDGKDKNSRTYRERIEAAGMPEEAKKVAFDELEKFEGLSENSPEYNLTRNYLETLCQLPWSEETKDNLDLGHARDVLDKEHYGLEKVKQRIIEFLAVRQLKQDPRGSIICLVGPPGVGKTSIGKSIAKTLGRNFFRFSLGGMRDEAEIKGHRRTYIGAMPGKVLQGMKRAGSKNAVLMLDEIDKLGQSYHGDPASALLEVLDPEQNNAFLDHYVDVPFDLSRVLFITTANTTSSIPAPLLDRMEVIELPGYTIEEKEDIATRYVIPREFEANGISPSQLRIDRAAVRKIMTDYAREPGLRSLQKLVNRISRKAAAKIIEAKDRREKPKPWVIKEADLLDWLGPKRFYNEIAERITVPGVIVGLAWTSMGGEILFIEATDTPGSGALKLTGQMGEVMTESASIAWSYIKKTLASDMDQISDSLNQASAKNTPKTNNEVTAATQLRRRLRQKDIHIHIPAGAIPKDGPSAGITLATALYSLMTGRRAIQKVAMTGELSLTGKVLPVGGIKEKILAAKRAGVNTLILPKLNEKDLFEIPKYALKDLTIHFVSRVEQVFELALEPVHSPSTKRAIPKSTNGLKKRPKLRSSSPKLTQRMTLNS